MLCGVVMTAAAFCGVPMVRTCICALDNILYIVYCVLYINFFILFCVPVKNNPFRMICVLFERVVIFEPNRLFCTESGETGLRPNVRILVLLAA